MKASDVPTRFPIPFADQAGAGFIRTIPEASQINIQAGAASLTDGFPPVTFDPVGAGGTPPWGQDFNGLFNQITQWNQWQAAVGPVVYDATFSASIGGYPAGAVLAAAANAGAFWFSTTDDNTTNPDSGGAGWVGFSPVGSYAADTGSVANVYVVASLPSTPLVGRPVRTIPAHSNTGASTLNGVAIQRRNGSALIGGELLLGQVATFFWTGTVYQIPDIVPASAAAILAGTDTQSAITPAQLTAAVLGIAGASSGIIGSAAGGTKTAAWTIDEIIAETALGGRPYRGSSLSLTFNGATIGANGMDTGTVPTSADLLVYAIFNPTTSTWATLGTVNGNGSTIYPGGNMPSGFTASALLWSGKTTAGANIVTFKQNGRSISIPTVQVINAGGSATFVTTSLVPAVPVNAKTCGGVFGTVGAGGMFLAVDAAGLGQIEVAVGTATGVIGSFNGLSCLSQQIFFSTSGSNGNCYISSYTI